MMRSILLIITMLSVGVVWANPVDTLYADMVYLQDVVITSFKQHDNLENEPISISSVSVSQMKQNQVVNMKELSSMVPNLFMPDYGSKLTSPVYIRGIGSKINSPSVGMYVDGIPYFEKSAFDINFSDVERVDVLRGPQGTLYGRNAMGGIINIYTRSPLDKPGTTLSYSQGSYDQIDATLAHYHKFNEKLGLSLAANYNHQDGFFENEYTGESADVLDAFASRIRLQWKPSASFSLGLVSSVDYSDQGGYPYAPYDKETGELAQVNYNDFSHYRRLIASSGLTMEYTHNRFALQSQTAFQFLDDDQGIDQDFTIQDIYYATQDQKQHMLSQEFTLKSTKPLAGHYNWLVGIFGFYQSVDNTVGVNMKKKDLIHHKLYNTPTYGAAIYHQSTVENLFIEGLTLSAGIRFDLEKAEGWYRDYMTQNGNTNEGSDYDRYLKFNQFTPKVSLQYHYFKENQLYASISKGYKSGGFNTSFEREEDKTFAPEYSWNYEIGFKNTLWDGKFQSDLTLFYIDWHNQQIYQPLPSGQGSMLKNAGQSSSKGVEFSLTAHPLNGWLLQLGYGYTYAKFEDYQRKPDVNYAGNFLPYVPRNTVSASSNYTWSTPIRGIDRIIFGLHYKGNGSLYWNDSNTASQSYYNIMDAKITVQRGPLSVALWGKNITNTKYNAYYFESGPQGYAQAGRPITFGLECSLKF